MSMRKSSQKKAKELRVALRTFPEWPVERVMEVARTLYATAPFQGDSWNDKVRWKSLARRANDFLDQLHAACTEIAKERSATDAAYRRSEERLMASETLPDQVPFEQAARFITSEKRKDRALPKLKKLVLWKPRYFGGLLGKSPTSREVNAQLKLWQRSGMPLAEVRELRILFEASWPRIIASQNSTKGKKRGPRLNRKDKPMIAALLRESASEAS